MIIQNERRKYVLIGTVIVGILLAIIFIFFSTTFHKPQLDRSIVLSLYSLLGIALIFSACMWLSTDSRKSSLLFGSIFLIITMYYFHPELLYIESIAVGLVIGGIIVSYVLLNNRFDILAIAAKGLLTIFFFIVIGVLIGSYFNALSLVPQSEFSSELATQVLFTHFMGIVFAFLAYLFLFYSIVGVKSSNIFVFGPRGSGKTYFMHAFIDHIAKIRSMNTKLKDDVILSHDDDAKNQYSYEKISEQLEAGEKPKSTAPYTILIYQFSAKIGLLRPVTWTFLDYAGEHMPEFSEKKYKAAIKYLAEKLAEKTKPAEKTNITNTELIPKIETELIKKSGTIEFCKYIQENFKKDLVVKEFQENLITAILHGYIQNAGKIIFLVDGEKVINKKKKDTDKDSRALLAGEFVLYNRILNNLDCGSWFNSLGVKKKFCVVITKLDEILNDPGLLGQQLREIASGVQLLDIHENSFEGHQFEKELHDDLLNMVKYQLLENSLTDIDFHFIAVSAHANANQTTIASENNALKMEPWGFGEVVLFSS